MPVAPTTSPRLTRRAGFTRSPARALRWPAFRRPQHAAAAARRAAAAGEDGIDVRRVVALAPDLIVVGELFARGDIAQRVDEHPRALDHRLAVRLAGVIDEARLVAADTRVDDRVLVGDEQERVVVVRCLVIVALVGLGVRDALAQVFEDARATCDRRQYEPPPTMERRVAHLDARRRRARVRTGRRLQLGARDGAAAAAGRAAHTATGALIGA